MLSDKILEINGQEIKDDLDKWIAEFEGKQLDIKVNRMGRELLIQCPNTNKSYFPIYKLAKAKNIANFGALVLLHSQ